MDCTKCGAPNGSEILGPDNKPTGDYWCCTCWNQSVADRRAARKAELAAMPRCEVSRCSRRGTWDVGHAPTVKLCGQHKNKARQLLAGRLAPAASIAMFAPVHMPGPDVLAMLEEAA